MSKVDFDDLELLADLDEDERDQLSAELGDDLDLDEVLGLTPNSSVQDTLDDDLVIIDDEEELDAVEDSFAEDADVPEVESSDADEEDFEDVVPEVGDDLAKAMAELDAFLEETEDTEVTLPEPVEATQPEGEATVEELVEMGLVADSEEPVEVGVVSTTVVEEPEYVYIETPPAEQIDLELDLSEGVQYSEPTPVYLDDFTDNPETDILILEDAALPVEEVKAVEPEPTTDFKALFAQAAEIQERINSAFKDQMTAQSNKRKVALKQFISFTQEFLGQVDENNILPLDMFTRLFNDTVNEINTAQREMLNLNDMLSSAGFVANTLNEAAKTFTTPVVAKSATVVSNASLNGSEVQAPKAVRKTQKSKPSQTAVTLDQLAPGMVVKGLLDGVPAQRVRSIKIMSVDDTGATGVYRGPGTTWETTVAPVLMETVRLIAEESAE